MLVSVQWWLMGSKSKLIINLNLNVATCLEAVCLGSLADLSNFAYRGPKVYDKVLGLIRATWRVWLAALRRFLRPNQ